MVGVQRAQAAEAGVDQPQVVAGEGQVVGVDREDALAFYKRFYAPNNAILVIAGNISFGQAKAYTEKWFGPIPAASSDSPAFSAS